MWISRSDFEGDEFLVIYFVIIILFLLAHQSKLAFLNSRPSPRFPSQSFDSQQSFLGHQVLEEGVDQEKDGDNHPAANWGCAADSQCQEVCALTVRA